MTNETLILEYLRSHNTEVYSTNKGLQWWISDDSLLSPVCLAIFEASVDFLVGEVFLCPSSIQALGVAEKYKDSRHYPGYEPISKIKWAWNEVKFLDVVEFLNNASDLLRRIEEN
jgi:hypothetical protein